MDVKEFKGNPTVYVASTLGGVEVTTPEHMRNANLPLKRILKDICEQARVHANEVFSKYDYPNGEWYPCGSADIILRWNDHREIINLFRKEATESRSRYWRGWFGRLMQLSGGGGWWWMPHLDRQSQSLKYEEDVCRFIREKLAYANIKVDIHSYID